MGQALKQINVLWKYAQVHGEDKLLSMTLSKLIESKIDQYNREIEELEEEMRKFERKYNIRSEKFYESYQGGEIGDAMDFHEWFAICDMHRRSFEERKFLREAKERQEVS